jgi:hypothetical protein
MGLKMKMNETQMWIWRFGNEGIDENVKTECEEQDVKMMKMKKKVEFEFVATPTISIRVFWDEIPPNMKAETDVSN